MHIQKLTENSIQVTVTLSDLMHFDMTIEQLKPDSKELHNFLFHVMETINEETDFNPFNGQIMMEATPSKDGVHIIVSKFGTEQSPPRRKIRSVSVKAKNSRSSIFYFNSFDEMCGAMSLISDSAVHNSELYFLDGIYCVIMRENMALSEAKSVLSEHSFRYSEHSMRAVFIREHGKHISSGVNLLNIIHTFLNN